MAITHKFSSALKLAQARTWVVDTDPTSRYFQMAQIPDVLTAGKNAFLINGAPELVTTTEVLVELIDAEGNTVFVHPIKNYNEGLARVVTLEVYNDTPPGLATLTIMGQIRQDENGNLPPVEFQNKYNVKWQRRIMISPSLGNKTPIRLLNHPTASVQEILNPLRTTTQSIHYLTGSVSLSLQGASLQNAIVVGDPTPNTYLIIASTASFTKQMEGGQLQAMVNATPFTASVVSVINNTMLQITPGYTSGSIFEPFITAQFTMSFTGSPVYSVTQATRSFADLTINRLSTFSGDIYRVKVFVSSVDSPGNAEMVMDSRIESAELMQTSSYASGQPTLRTGYFQDNTVPSNYWVIGKLAASMSLYNPM